MSYARFGWDKSDVYVFMNVGGYLECCLCALSDEDFWNFNTYHTSDMILHLRDHELAGHNVPAHVYIDLANDDERNFGDRSNTAGD